MGYGPWGLKSDAADFEQQQRQEGALCEWQTVDCILKQTNNYLCSASVTVTRLARQLCPWRYHNKIFRRSAATLTSQEIFPTGWNLHVSAWQAILLKPERRHIRLQYKAGQVDEDSTDMIDER